MDLAKQDLELLESRMENQLKVQRTIAVLMGSSAFGRTVSGAIEVFNSHQKRQLFGGIPIKRKEENQKILANAVNAAGQIAFRNKK